MSTVSGNAGSQLVILHQSLNNSDIHGILKIQQYRIKVSTGTVKNTCIFPQSTAAFMILPTTKILNQSKAELDTEIATNLMKFSELHHKCYVFLSAPLIGATEQEILSLLQEQFLDTDLHFLPIHNANECAECMLSITKVLCKPLSDVIRERFQRLQSQVCSEENILSVLGEFGIDQRTGIFLLDGCGGLAGIAEASKRGELIDYNVSHSLIVSIQSLLT